MSTGNLIALEDDFSSVPQPKAKGSSPSLLGLLGMGSKPKGPTDLELATVEKPAGFVDPFDELASRSTRGPSTATTHHHTSSHPSHSFTDPLDALWGAGGPDPLGAHNAPGQPSHTGVSSSHAAHAGTGSGDGPSSHFWDFELSPPSTSTSPGPGDQPPPRTGGLPPPPPSAGASARHGGSTGDLLDLGFGGSSSSPGSVADRASSHEAVRGGSTSGPSHSRSSLTQPHTHAHAKSAGNLESMDGGTAGGTGGTDGDSLFGSTGSTGLSAGSKAGGQDGDGTTMGAALQTQEQRPLLIYAVPLMKERLVFLPVAEWAEEEKKATELDPPPGIVGSLSAGVAKLSHKATSLWQRMGTKDPGTLQHTIYEHGTRVIENMSAEERLMRNIPKAATKVVVYHPTSVSPTEVQEQLTKMSSQYVMKSAGKAAAAGLLLPVAVGVEIIAVPGTGWFMLYQLYKATTSASGGQRLQKYLAENSDVRVCYAGEPRLDRYLECARHAPDGLLTQDDIDDLCHDLEQWSLGHPLSELRARYLKRIQQKTGDYALLPANEGDDGEGHGDAGPKPPAARESKGSGLAGLWRRGG